jgi:integration host factor subunit beta
MLKFKLTQRILRQNPHLRQSDAAKVNVILEEIITAMARGDRVELRGFGAFGVKQHPARIGRNPKTGDPVAVDRKSMPHFKAGKEMRERLNEQGNGAGRECSAPTMRTQTATALSLSGE